MKNLVLALLISIGSSGLWAQCAKPANFTIDNITVNSIDIDLTASGNGPWEIQYGINGFTFGSGTYLLSNNPNITITGLMSGTTYRVYLRRGCGATSSVWTNFSFSTNCGSAVSAPVHYDFESSIWDTPGNAYDAGIMDTCWVVTPAATSSFWAVGPPNETRLTTGPVGDHTTGYGQFIHYYGRGISTDSLSYINMPAIDLGGLSNPKLSFWYHLYGAGIDSLNIEAKSNTDTLWQSLHLFYGQQQMEQTDPWQQLVLPLDSFLNTVVNIRFAAYGKGTNVHVSIDDISVYDSSSCQPSTYFRATSVSDNSVLLDWDEGSATVHKIEFGKKGFTPGTGTKITVGQPPFRVNGLSADTTYVFYLRDDCASGKFSTWTGPLEVNTDCAPTVAPYFEDFEGSPWPIGQLQHCWDRFDYLDFKWNTGPPSLSWSQSGPGFNNHTPGGSKFIVADRPNMKGKARTSITSPLIDLSAINNPELIFWSHMFGLQITAFEIAIDSGDGFRLLKKVIGPQQLSKGAAWTEHIIALPGYSGKKVKVMFTGIAGSNWSSLSRIAVDDISIDEAPLCRKPTNLQVGQVSYTSAVVSWISGGSSDWMVRLEPTGGTSIYQPNSANPLDLTQLQPGTEYTIWIRDSCGVGVVSDWSAPLTFKTFCLPDTTPYFQDFEDPQFVVQSSYFSTGYLGPCWERSSELGPIWQPSPASSFPNSLTPIADHTTGSGKYIGGALFLGNGSNDPTSFTSPHIDLSNLPGPELSFWYFLGGFSFSNNQIKLEVNDGSGWQLMTTIYGPQQSSVTAPWLEQIVDLSSFVDDTIRLRFTSIGDNLYSTSAAGIDDIHIYNVLFCLPPSDLKAHYVSSTKAMLGWKSGGATDWVLKYRPDGGTFQYQNTSVNDTFALNGLTPNTRYEIWVRDSCGNEVSAWHGPIYILTDCLPTQVPYYEGMDGPSWIPAASFNDIGVVNTCWRRPDSSYNVWVTKTGSSGSTLSGPSGPRTGSGNYMMVKIFNASSGTSKAELISLPVVNSGLQQPELNYWYHMYGPQIQNLKVYVERTDGSRVLVDSLIGQQQTGNGAAWLQRTVSLSAFQGDTVKIAFVGQIGNTFGLVNMAIDDVEIVDAICSAPANLSASNITFNSADLIWNSGSAHSNIEYGLAGFTMGSGTMVFGTSSGYSLTGLQPFTTYDYYVQDSCGAINSPWSGPYSFTTSCTQPIATFSHQGTSRTINFDASSSNGINLTYFWEFGDGATGSGMNPPHTYTSSGTYAVVLITTDACGFKDTLIQNIQVCEAPNAVINYTRTGLTVNFSGVASTGATQYYWDLGPAGIFITDTAVAVFPAKGTYQVYLVVTNACGTSDTTYLNLVICDKPTASFTANISTVIAPTMIVDFDGTASIYADSFSWDFGDGSSPNTTSLTPTHVYTTTSLNYLVTLIVKADCGLYDTLAYKLSSISLEEINEPSMSVYPNPANEQVTVVSDNMKLQEQDLQWFDLAGKQLHVPATRVSEGHFSFDVSGLPAGEYLLVNSTDQGGAVKVTVR